jgi:two-component system, NarL family, invasion response regulator UvrY
MSFQPISQSAQRSTTQLRILVADAHPVVRRGVRHILTAGFTPVQLGEAATGQEILAAVRRDPWDLITLDAYMPGGSALEIVTSVQELVPDVRILVLSVHAQVKFALCLLKSGVSGYLTKDCAPKDLILAVKQILRGGQYVSPVLAQRIAMSLNMAADKLVHERLSERECQVMRMIARGMTVGEIACALSLQVRTVDTFRGRIMRKLHLKSPQAIAYYANKAGIT